MIDYRVCLTAFDALNNIFFITDQPQYDINVFIILEIEMSSKMSSVNVAFYFYSCLTTVSHNYTFLDRNSKKSLYNEFQ